jgi:hypothetical protein
MLDRRLPIVDVLSSAARIPFPGVATYFAVLINSSAARDHQEHHHQSHTVVRSLCNQAPTIPGTTQSRQVWQFGIFCALIAEQQQSKWSTSVYVEIYQILQSFLLSQLHEGSLSLSPKISGT